jgi:peptidoglycan/LPS O-acetylase OafA/YrhL
MFATVPLFEYGSIGFAFAYCGYLQRIGHNKNETRIFFLFSAALYIFTLQLTDNFVFGAQILSAALVIYIVFVLYDFKLKPVNNFFAAKPIMLLARYSLEFYVIHYIAFRLIGQQ